METRFRFALSTLSLLLLSSLSFSFSASDVETAQGPTAQGPLGSYLYYQMYSPLILKVGTNTTIEFRFTAETEIFIKSIYISYWGTAFRSIPDFIVSELVMSNETLHTHQSINYSIPVKPLEEGIIVVHVKAEYDFTGGSDYDYQEIVLEAKPMTYDELAQGYTLFRNLTLAFLISTIILVLIIVYTHSKK